MYIILQYSKIHLLLILLMMILHVNFLHANCESDVGIGYQVTLAIPPAYGTGFVGRAFLMETDQLLDPNFRTALSVEGLEARPDENYSCSLDIFLGNVKVWSSGHFSRFYTADKCTLELTQFGDLQLKGQKDTIGWRSGTSGQGVQRLQLLRSGNLVLVDAHNLIKWQSFNFPTDIMLWGQRLSSKTRLTSFISNNSTRIFYTLEVQYDKIALFLNYGTWKYSYWEFRPLGERNITYVELSSNALEIFNGKFQKVAQITSQQQQEPLRFLALENATGNLGLYYYSAQKDGFQASYQALNITCDLPLACKPYGICTFSQTCSCVRLITRGAAGARSLSGCSSIITGSNGGDESGSEEGGLCGSRRAEMVELEGVTSILRGVPSKVRKVSREGCGNLCVDNCTCVAALYTSSESSEDMDGADQGVEEAANCFLYGLVRGVKQVERGNAILTSYMVKVPKESSEDDAVRDRSSSGLKRWVVVVIGMGDGLVILMVVGGIGCYLIRKRRNNSLDQSSSTPPPPPPPAATGRNPSHSFQNSFAQL